MILHFPVPFLLWALQGPCQRFMYTERLIDDKGTLVLYEKWDSRNHHQKYMAWCQETGALAQLGAALTGPPIIRYFDRVDA